MLYCEKCRVKMNWPKGILGEPTSFGNCEMCSGQGRQPCYDIPCSYLPDRSTTVEEDPSTTA